MIEFALIVLAAYLLGAIPVGLVLGKLRGVDVTEYGSGKIGFANVLRILGARYAAIVFVADILKGVIAVLIAKFTLHSNAGEMAAAFAAIAGHNWSVYIKFKGGRGVNTSVGGLLAMEPMAGAIGLAVFWMIVGVSRYISLGSMLGGLSAVVAMIVLFVLGRTPLEFLIYTLVAVALIVIQHRDNILRLLSGGERKVGEEGERRKKT